MTAKILETSPAKMQLIVHQRIKEAEDAIDAQAQEVRRAYEAQVAAQLRERNPDLSEADAIAAAAGLTTRETIPLDFVLYISRNETITARDLLRDAAKYDGKAIPDPIEGPDYGVTTAQFYANARTGEPMIRTYAHGEGYYKFEIDYVDEFDVITCELEAEDVGDVMPQKLHERYIFVTGADRYYDMNTHTQMTANAVNTVNKPVYKGTKGSPLATNVLMDSGVLECVEGVTWEASQDVFVTRGVKRFVNTYEGPTLEPIPGDVSLWIGLCNHIFGDYVDHVLDHMAFTLQCPEMKIRWQILTFGKPRTGKTRTLMPLRKILGDTYKVVDSDGLDHSWGDIWARAKVVVLEEVYRDGDARFYNRIKAKLSNDDIEILNIKGQGMLHQRNQYSIYMFTNHVNAIHMDAGERKLLVIKAPDVGYGIEECAAIESAVNSGRLANHVYDYLLKRDVTSFNHDTLPVMTAAALEMCSMGKTSAEMALDDVLVEEVEPGGFISADALRRMVSDRAGNNVGYKPLAVMMKAREYASVRGLKKVDGKVVSTKAHWYKPTLREDEYSSSELYDLITNQNVEDF